MAEVESDEMLLPYFEYSLIPPSNTKGNVRKIIEKRNHFINHYIEFILNSCFDVSRNYECLKWKSPKKMTMTFVKFQEDISMTGELFLHYNYPANWWAHLKTSGALIMISNDTNLFRRREQKHILRKSKGSWLFRFVCVLEDFYMLMFYGIQDDHLPTGLFKHNFRLALFSM